MGAWRGEVVNACLELHVIASLLHVIASTAKQSILSYCGKMDCFAALAMTTRAMDCFVARAPLRKRFAFVAGDDDVEVLVICPTG